jgi:hypothetical protein
MGKKMLLDEASFYVAINSAGSFEGQTVCSSKDSRGPAHIVNRRTGNRVSQFCRISQLR